MSGILRGSLSQELAASYDHDTPTCISNITGDPPSRDPGFRAKVNWTCDAESFDGNLSTSRCPSLRNSLSNL